jgi:hypothetical protein
MATTHKSAKLRDRLPSNNNTDNLQLHSKEKEQEGHEQSNSRFNKNQSDLDMFASNALNSKEAEVDQFSISAHSSDSGGGFKGKGNYWIP